uniref:Uncharacterized protein n=1 Tax=Panagrolaimus superbus TaxID=310955 RepID=A0A914XVM1_9BILA
MTKHFLDSVMDIGKSEELSQSSNGNVVAAQDETESTVSHEIAADESQNKLEVLMKDLDIQTKSFIETITQTTVKHGIRRKPLPFVGYERFQNFAASIDQIIKFYEKENEKLQASIDPLLNAITEMEQTSTKVVIEKEAKIKALEEMIEEMKTSQNLIQQKCKEFEQKEATLNEQLITQNDTNEFQVQMLNLNLEKANDAIHYWKQKFEEANRRSQNTELNGRITQLEAELHSKTEKSFCHKFF